MFALVSSDISEDFSTHLRVVFLCFRNWSLNRLGSLNLLKLKLLR